jgi:hypothetical protein
MFRYRLHSPDGDDLGEATYAQMTQQGDEIHLGSGQLFRVLDMVSFEEEDESPFVGLLQVEAVQLVPATGVFVETGRSCRKGAT